MYKALNNLGPGYISIRIEFLLSLPGGHRDLQRSLLAVLHDSDARLLSARRRAFIIMGWILWNSLPAEIRQSSPPLPSETSGT